MDEELISRGDCKVKPQKRVINIEVKHAYLVAGLIVSEDNNGDEIYQTVSAATEVGRDHVECRLAAASIQASPNEYKT